MKIISEWKEKKKKEKELNKQIKALRTVIIKQGQEIEEKDNQIDYYMDMMHRYKNKSLELRRKIMEMEKHD